MPSGLCDVAYKAIIGLCDIVEALQATSLGITAADHVLDLVRSFMAACVDAGWRDNMIPKFHWMLHFRGRILLIGFVHERKHTIAKRQHPHHAHLREICLARDPRASIAASE